MVTLIVVFYISGMPGFAGVRLYNAHRTGKYEKVNSGKYLIAMLFWPLWLIWDAASILVRLFGYERVRRSIR